VDERFPQSKRAVPVILVIGQERVGRLHLSLEETGCLLKRLHLCGRKLELIRYAVVFVSVWFVLLCFWNRGGDSWIELGFVLLSHWELSFG
jgi:hypothetical protein